MGERVRGRGGVAIAVAVAALLAGRAVAEVAPEERALLAESNLFAVVPEQFEARLTITSGGRPMRVRVWRGGRDRLLVQPQEAKQAGRFLLQLGADRYLIAPGAREPVKLGAGVALAGAVSAENVLGLDVERDFDVERVQAEGRVVTFHLKARPDTAAARATPAARWVVDRTTRLPLRVDVVLADGRTARVVEFAAFMAGRRGVPSRLVLKDVLRGGPPATVEVEAFDAVPVPDGLFSLTDGAARAKLLAAPTPPR
ncbi:MAG: hypothetical protein HY825_16605 [Acidobacteria bacterium]|nr:hypothetical protein [Acidobacteriota bacterium]